MPPQEAKALKGIIEEATRESDPRKQAKLLAPLSQSKTWQRAFSALDRKDLPQLHVRRLPYDPRARKAVADLRLLSETLAYDSIKPPAVMRALCMALRLLWPSVWSWIKLLDPLSGNYELDDDQSSYLSDTVLRMLLAAVMLTSVKGDDQEMTATMQGEPLDRLLALWYHAQSGRISVAAFKPELKDDVDPDELVFVQTTYSHGVLAEYLLACTSPYHERTVQILYNLSHGRPERIRRRLLASLEQGLRLRCSIADADIAHTYVQPIARLHAVEAFHFAPPRKKTVQRIADHLLRFSQAPETTIRAVSMCTVLLCLHRRQPGERVIALAISRGLLVGLRNILSHLPVVPLEELANIPMVLTTAMTIVLSAFRLRCVTRNVVRVKEMLLPFGKLLNTENLRARWEQFLDGKRLHTLAWNAYRKRLTDIRCCVNIECTTPAPLVRSCICQEAYYCSRECQRMDWRSRHRRQCLGKRDETDLTLEDRIFLEEVARSYVNGDRSLLRGELTKPVLLRDLKTGCHAEIHVLFEKDAPNVNFRVATVERIPDDATPEPLLYIVGHLEYYEEEYTLRLDPSPLVDFMSSGASQRSRQRVDGIRGSRK
ncbi:hypothetical protein HDZ31DRAFT_40432 [Schizophyllum fasciatum]